MESARNYKRRNYFIDKSFQSRFILRFCLVVFLGGILTIAILYLLAMQSTTVSIINSRVVASTTADFLLPILIQTVIIVTIMTSLATIAVTLLVSHKISGPIFRFKQVMETLGKGDFSQEFHIRHLDQLQDLANEINLMVVTTKRELQQLKFSFTSLKEKLDNIPEQDLPENKRVLLSELKRLAQEIKKKLDYFKT